MPFPALSVVPGTKLLVLGVETEVFKFEETKHFQCTISLNQFVNGESVEFRFYTKRPSDSLFYQEGLPVTFAGQVGGGGPNGQKHYTIDFRAGVGVRVTALQTGGSARTVDWFVLKV